MYMWQARGYNGEGRAQYAAGRVGALPEREVERVRGQQRELRVPVEDEWGDLL